MKNEWKRNCPECNEEMIYKYSQSFYVARKKNTNCKSCSKKGKNAPWYGKFGKNNFHFGKKRSNETRGNMSKSRKGIEFSEEHKNNLSKSKMGDKNPAKCLKVRKKISEAMMGDKNPAKRSDVRKKMSNNNSHYWLGKKLSEETKKKMRLSAIKNIKNRCGQISPNYNPVACEMIRWYNMYYGFNFRHAENGGEKCIGGYFPDGLDEKRKTIIEIDELRHYDKNGNLKQRDIERQKFLENKGYKVIRIRI